MLESLRVKKHNAAVIQIKSGTDAFIVHYSVPTIPISIYILHNKDTLLITLI